MPDVTAAVWVATAVVMIVQVAGVLLWGWAVDGPLYWLALIGVLTTVWLGVGDA